MARRTDSQFRPLLILLLAVAILAIISCFELRLDSSFIQVKRIDIFSDLRQVKASPPSLSPPAMDEAADIAVQETAGKAETAKGEPVDGGNNRAAMDARPLRRFYEALGQAETSGGKVRIAYFGDSLIEGDLITQDIRRVLQKRFGGRGVGFVPITSVSSRSRTTIRHGFSDDWNSISALQRSAYSKQPGFSGFLFIPGGNKTSGNIIKAGLKDKPQYSWVRYGTDGSGYSSPSFDAVDLLYENPGSPLVMQYNTENSKGEKVILETTSGPSKVNLDKGRDQRQITLMFSPSELLKIYGVSFEAESGVYVDNFSLRGASGTNLAGISCRMLSDFNKLREYSLIVLHYGPNIANPAMTDFGWYRKKMVSVVNHLKECLPETSIMLVSVGDVCTGQGDRIHSAPCVPHLVDAQREIANETAVGFWNLFDAMGGTDSMARWVQSRKPLANPDCTHLNVNGAKTVGNMFVQELLDGYDRFRQDSDVKITRGTAR